MPRRKTPVTINLPENAVTRLQELTQQTGMDRGQVITLLIMNADLKVVLNWRNPQEPGKTPAPAHRPSCPA